MLAPLLNAPIAIQAHAFAALALLPLTLTIFSLPRGRGAHKPLGYLWCGLMAFVAISSFWIHEINLVAGLSPIHLLSAFVLINLSVALYAARSGNIRRHRRAMLGMVYGALIGAGAFTLLPGRIMHAVLLG